MKPTRKTAIKLMLLLFSQGVYASPEVVTDCTINSLSYLADLSSEYMQRITLTQPASQPQGRALLHNEQQYEIWVKTHAYSTENKSTNINSYSITLIDKASKSMLEASSSAFAPNRDVTLTAHRLNEDFQPSARLIVTCHEARTD